MKQLEDIRKGRLKFKDLLYSTRVTEEMAQVDLAALCGSSRSKICDFEKGRRIPTLVLAAKLTKALGHSEALFVSKIIEEQLEEANLKLKFKLEAA